MRLVAINPKFLSVVLLLLCITTSKAQENDIRLFGNDSQSMQRQSITSEDRSELKKFVYDKIDSARFLSNSESSPIMLSTERIITDVTSLPLLSNERSKMVQVVIVKILNESELSQTIDYSVFDNFTNLKYIYISCEIKADLQQIIRMIKIKEETKNLTTYLGFNLPE